MEARRFIKKLFSSRIFLLFFAAVLIFTVHAFYREFVRRYNLEQEVKKLQIEVEEADKKNQDLTDTLKYLQTSSFTEEEARVKLGLQKPGEKVIIIDDGKTDIVNDREGDPAAISSSYWQNLHKWYEYFFKNNK